MKVKDFIHHIQGSLVKGTLETEINSIAYDSRKVGKNSLFVAIKGYAFDGHSFIGSAIKKGSVCVIAQSILHGNLNDDVTFIEVKDSRKALAQTAQLFYHNPSNSLTCVGVTGTNGKTTTCHIIKSIVEAQNIKAGLSGTVHNLIGNRYLAASHTTPESLELQKLLREMVDEECRYAIIEVSSHALALNRLDGCLLQIAAFTNFSRDHLDFHGSSDEYFSSKKKIFDYLSPESSAVINIDDPLLNEMVETLTYPVISCGTKKNALIRAEHIKQKKNGLSMEVFTPEGRLVIKSPLVGRTNVENLLVSLATAYGLGIAPEVIEKGIREMELVPGRFERFELDKGSTAIVDYAHTDDALRRILTEARSITSNRLITVFGCGGDRDKGKRPLMGLAASELSDIIIITSDNPRNEEPLDIINDIVKGVKGNRYVIISDRKEAINKALTMAQSGDTVVIAGKGHENYQEIKGVRYPLSDREMVKEFLE